MRKYNLPILMAVLSMLLCTACYKDKGNYDYKDLPQVVFDKETSDFIVIDEDGEESSTSYLSLRYGETLRIRPNYTLSKNADVALKFTWTLRDEAGNETVVGNTETLEWQAEKSMKGRLIVDIEDVTNGTHFPEDISIEVSEPYEGMGYLVLSEKDGKKMLSFFAGSYMDLDESEYAANPFDEFYNIYESVNKEALPDNVIKIHEHYHREGNDSGEPAQLMAVCSDQLIDFSSSLFTEVIRSDEFFTSPIANIRDVQFMQWIDLVVNDKGQLFQRRKTTDELFHSQKFLSEPMKYKGTTLEGIQIIPGVYSGTYRGFALLYDSKNSRYLTISDQKFHNWSSSEDESYVGKISELKPESEKEGWPDGFTPLSDMSGYDLIYTGSNNLTDDWSGGWQCVSIIREKATGKYYYQKFEVTHGYNSDDNYVTGMEQGELPSKLAANITADTKFALAERFTGYGADTSHPYLFAACGSDLYLYDMQDMEDGVSEPLSFESPIVDLCMERYAGSYVAVGLEDGSFYAIRTGSAKNYWSWSNKSRLVRYYVPAGKLGKILGMYYKSDGRIITFPAL